MEDGIPAHVHLVGHDGVDGGPAEESNPVELPAIQVHLQKGRVVPGRTEKTASATEVGLGPFHRKV